MADTSLFLSVPGLTGRSTVTGYTGDFTPLSYSFDVNGGTASVLTLDLGAPGSSAGILGLYEDALTGHPLSNVTLYATSVADAGHPLLEKIVLTDAFVASYADLGDASLNDDVTVNLDYKTATITAYTGGVPGTIATTTTVAGPASVALATTEPGPGTSDVRYFLDVPGLNGGSALAGYMNDFDLSGYSLGVSYPLATVGNGVVRGGQPAVDPLTVTLTGAPTPGEGKLLADVVSGAILPSVTLYETAPGNGLPLEYEIVLKHVTVEEEQASSTGASFGFNYGTITVTDYTPTGQGSLSTAGASFTQDVIVDTVTAAPTLALTGSSDTSLFLSVPGLTGRSTVTGYTGDFTPLSYSFDVNGGTASVLTLDLGAPGSSAGILGLYEDALTGHPLSNVTLYATSVADAGHPLLEKIVLTDAFVASYADLNNDVAVNLDFKTATITAYTGGVPGTIATTTTVAGPASVALATAEPGPGTSDVRYFLDVPGLNGGSALAGYMNDFELSGYNLGVSTPLATVGNGVVRGGQPAVDPLTVTLTGAPTPGEGKLLADVVSGAILPSVTLYETAPGNGLPLEYEIVLKHVKVGEEQASSSGVSFSLNYGTITVTDYTPTGQGSTSTAGASFTQIVTADTVTAAPTLALTGSSHTSLFLSVPGLTGASAVTGYIGDFRPLSYSFDVNGGTASVLTLDLGAPGSSAGILGLYEDALTGHPLSNVTLYATSVADAGHPLLEKIVLTDAFVASYADLNNDVAVNLDFKTATITAYTGGVPGTIATTTTVAGPASVALATTEPGPGTSDVRYFLDVPGLNGGSPAAGYLNDFELSGYNLGVSTPLATVGNGVVRSGRSAVDPLTVTLTGAPTPGEGKLLADVVSGAILPSVTLYETAPGNGLPLEYEIVLKHVTVEEEQASSTGASFGFNYGTITVTDYTPTGQGSMSTAGASFTQDVIVDTACFCAGTLIRTPSGDVPVERLVTGDRIVTLSGAAKPIVWIGQGKVAVQRGRRCAATPVLVRKSALADNVPHRDLRITKGHSLWLDGVLIPAEFLVNHRSILWDDHAQTVVFYHLELAEHGVLFANGVPAESYRDDGNRWLFETANHGWSEPPKPACAPVLTGGPVVDAQWRRLLDRAGPPPNRPLTEDPDLHLLVGGKRIDCLSRSNGSWMFRLPVAPLRVRIASNTAVPAELGLARDPRSLGIALHRIVLRQGNMIRVLRADDPKLVRGFHAFEPDNAYRWTNGDGLVPAELFAGMAGACMLELVVAETATYPLLAAA